MPKKTFRQKRGSKKRSSKKRASQRGGVRITFEKRFEKPPSRAQGKTHQTIKKVRAPFLEPNALRRLKYEDSDEDEDSDFVEDPEDEDSGRPAEAAGDGPNSGDEDAYFDELIKIWNSDDCLSYITGISEKDKKNPRKYENPENPENYDRLNNLENEKKRTAIIQCICFDRSGNLSHNFVNFNKYVNAMFHIFFHDINKYNNISENPALVNARGNFRGLSKSPVDEKWWFTPPTYWWHRLPW